jgi:septal ring factor EnvC (AmiA/AmiB activator)
VKKPDARPGRARMTGYEGLAADMPQSPMAFSLEEAPCGSTGFFTLERMSEKRVYPLRGAYPLRMESMRRMMHKSEEIDQFQMLEDKVDSLIKMVTAIKRERESLLEKVHIQEEKIAHLASEAEALKATRDKTKQRILSLLEKIEQIEIKA